ncbi:unnamed protein product [Meloidogyne enterolobii]|uniref:Uncharacterized protein n=1 Tax=Meloidogyne enterolobii TaxID=390850 RepID=A0ACB0YGW0_MELEN
MEIEGSSSAIRSSPPRSIVMSDISDSDILANPAGSPEVASKEGSVNVMKELGVALEEIEKETSTSEAFANVGNDAWPDFPEAMDEIVTKDKLAVVYFVAQGQGDYVIACRKSADRHTRWPYFMYIPDSLVDGHPDFQRKLEVGDLVSVSRFAWSEKFRDLAATREEVTSTKKFWLNESTQLLPRQADAEELGNIIYDDQERQMVTGVIYYIRFRSQHDPETFQYAELACCGIAHSARINRRHLNGISVQELVQGMLVNVSCIKIPRDSLISRTYVLPSNTLFRAGTETLAVFPEIYGAVGLVNPHLLEWPNTNINGTPKVFPCSAELSQDYLKCAEHVVGSALQIEMEREVEKMIEARFEGRAREITGRRCLICFNPRPKEEISKYAAAWELEAIVKISKNLGQKGLCYGTIRQVDVVNSERNLLELHVVIILNNIDQGRKNKEIGKELNKFLEGGLVVIHPTLPLVVEDRVRCFRCNFPSTMAVENSPRGHIMATLLGRPIGEGVKMVMDDVNDQADQAGDDEEFHPVIQTLNGRQRVTARLLMTGGLVHQQAPPGTGKTKVAAAIVKAWRDLRPEGQIAVMACSNIPVVKLVQETAETCGEEELEDMQSLALFSAMAKEKYNEQIRDVERHTLINKISNEAFRSKLQQPQKKEVDEYRENYLNNPRVSQERKIGRLYKSFERPNITFSTASMATFFLEGEGNIVDTELLLFDESTQAQWAVVVHLVACLPKLRAILLTGDRHQLGVYLAELPEVFWQGFGLESVIKQVEISPGANYTFLTKMYRSHPFLVQLISYASYELFDERLIPSRSEEERSLLTSSEFLLPIQSCPVGLINAYSSFRTDSKSDSLTDDHQTEVAEFLVQALLHHFGPQFSKSIVVLCMYTYQTTQIASRVRELGVRTLTVDSYQAQECDVTIIVTTRSRYAEHGSGKSDNMHFFKNNERATVALSRARHAIFLIGDLVSISEGPIWKRFLEKAITRTRVVKSEYVSGLLDGTLERSSTSDDLYDKSLRGTVEDKGFLGEWALKHGLRPDRMDLPAPPEEPTRPTFRFQHFPALNEAGPSGSGTSGNSRSPARREDRGRGRRGADGQWLNYAGNPKRQRGKGNNY